MTFFAGVEGFKGPQNLGQDGSFGFNAGFNTGFRLPCMPCDLFDAQLGLNAVSANQAGANFTPSTRDQLFLTGGFFRRVDYGLQGGVVVDYRRETWYTKTELTQLRGNLSWAYPSGDELGFQFASSLRNVDQPATINSNSTTASLRVLDTFNFYYQHTFNQRTGASGRANLGWTNRKQGLIGADFWNPLGENFALSSSFVYIIPRYNTNPQGNIDETWNVGMNLIWYPMGLTKYRGRYHRPMFNVADNGTFFTTPNN